MNIIDEIKEGLKNLYDPMVLEEFFAGLDEGAFMAEETGGPTVYTIYHNDLRIETTVHNNPFENKGWISVFKDDNLVEKVPFEYEAEQSEDDFKFLLN